MSKIKSDEGDEPVGADYTDVLNNKYDDSSYAASDKEWNDQYKNMPKIEWEGDKIDIVGILLEDKKISKIKNADLSDMLQSRGIKVHAGNKKKEQLITQLKQWAIKTAKEVCDIVYNMFPVRS